MEKQQEHFGEYTGGPFEQVNLDRFFAWPQNGEYLVNSTESLNPILRPSRSFFGLLLQRR